MRITLLAVGHRQPKWVTEGFHTYQQRLPKSVALELEEIPVATRSSTASPQQAVDKEGKRMLRQIRDGQHLVTLDVTGTAWSSAELAEQMAVWMQHHPRVALAIGGPDGLSAACRKRANQSWSLSPLTLPHGLVRVIVAEQLYRAWTLLQGHPYHRA